MIKKLIDSIADDKKDHVLMGMVFGYPALLIGFIIDLITGTDFYLIVGGILAIIAVGAKELVYDKWMKKGNPEWLDFIASAIPIIIPIMVYCIKYIK